MLELNKIYKAKQQISGFVNKTPFIYSSFLSDICQSEIYLKNENLQITGAYKISWSL